MSKRGKDTKKIVEEVSLYIFLKEKEIEFLENIQKTGMEYLPQDEREYTMKVLGDIVEEKKKELEKYQLSPLVKLH
jgi:hypothetical protein